MPRKIPRTIGRRHLLAAASAAPFALAGVPAFAAEKVLTVGAAVFPDTLKPGIGSFASQSLLVQTNEQLVQRDAIGNPQPTLATSWEQVDPLTLRFHLRQGVKFTDGVEFTADDVVYTIGYVQDPQNAYGAAARISQVSGAVAVDKYTVDIKTKAVFPTLLRAMAEILILPKHYAEKVGTKGMTDKPMGAGPFIFQEWVPGDHYTLVANKDYWAGAPKVDKVIIRTIPDGSTRVAALVSGEAQIIEEVPIDLIDQVQSSGVAKVDEIATSVGLVLTFDTLIKPFDNPKVREAFDYAIDKPLILKQILKGQGEILDGQVLTKAALGYNPDIKARPFDPAKAKQMLVEAGYDFNTPVPITTQNGKYVSDTDICNAIAGMLNNIGVKATVNAVEGGTFQSMSNVLKMGPLHMIGWYSLGDADFATVWYTKAGHRTNWYNAEYEKLFTEARSTNDEKERVRLYHEMSVIAFNETPSLFLFGLPSLYGVNKDIKGFGAASDKILHLAKVELK
jgi:peptide/nickel transport system substrate-binding protein